MYPNEEVEEGNGKGEGDSETPISTFRSVSRFPSRIAVSICAYVNEVVVYPSHTYRTRGRTGTQTQTGNKDTVCTPITKEKPLLLST